MADAQDAIALLKHDHRTVENLFEQFEKTIGDGRKRELTAEYKASGVPTPKLTTMETTSV